MCPKRRTLFDLSCLNEHVRLIKMNCIITEKNYLRFASMVAASGKEPSLLMNEAIGDLIRKYQDSSDNTILHPHGKVEE